MNDHQHAIDRKGIKVNTLACVLSVCLAICWGVAAVDPAAGTVSLGIAGSILTFPHFWNLFSVRIAQNMGIAFVLLAIGVVVPPLLPLVGIWAFICLINKLQRLASNLPLILVGAVTYASTAFLPSVLLDVFQSYLAQAPPELLLVLVGIFGWVFFWLVIRLTMMFGSSSPNSNAAFLLGFWAYLFLFILTFFVPHIEGGDA